MHKRALDRLKRQYQCRKVIEKQSENCTKYKYQNKSKYDFNKIYKGDRIGSAPCSTRDA